VIIVNCRSYVNKTAKTSNRLDVMLAASQENVVTGLDQVYIAKTCVCVGFCFFVFFAIFVNVGIYGNGWGCGNGWGLVGLGLGCGVRWRG
jgi:hypothetical protein